VVQEEPVLPRDLVMKGMLKSIGIEKGKDFKPDAAKQSILKSAVQQEAQAQFIDLLTSYSHPWWPDRSWSTPDPRGVKTGFQTADALDVDARVFANYAAFPLPKKNGENLGVSLHVPR
jgi:hypothetical protein